ncbi:hypothetical protein [Candidatus Nitrospira nitrificans]|nr:hypothetical protein [Candidatus Nitrospira nitrificans]
MDEETKRAIDDLITASPKSSPISEKEIASTRGDKQLLKLLERCCQDGGDIPFPSEFDPIFEKLSFTAKSLTPDQRRTAWSEFETEHDVTFGWAEKQGIALWYRDHDVLDHAAAVYEDLHRDARTTSEVDKSYLLETMGVYAQLGEYERVRELLVHVKEAYEAKEVDREFYEAGLGYVAEAARSYSGIESEDDAGIRNTLLVYIHELESDRENARLEISRLQSGVLFKEERQAAIEWLNQNLGQLVRVLSPDAKESLIEAVLNSRSPTLQIEQCRSIPQGFGRAVEAEFNEKVWDIVKSKLDEAIKRRFSFVRYDLSINNIYRILADEGSGKTSEVRLASRPYIIELLGQDILANLERNRLNTLSTHFTDARHGSRGGRKYTVKRLNQFLDDIGVLKPNGWIYGFLQQLQLGRPKAK